ncbi:hypothetical protein GGI23_002340 [Coemansia sp. RSA 2559]|nr:hypothetical protein GGI23_002340 [Coemansia sp. RSA 2559]
MSRATDPINDIGSPINLQYLQYAMSGASPFLVAADGSLSAITSPVSAPIGMPPKQQQQQRHLPSLVVSSSSPSAMASTSAAAAAIANSMGRSPPMATPYAARTLSQPPSAKALSPSNLGTVNEAGSPLPGFFHPAEVFTTPETRTIHEPTGIQATPELALFDDADAIGALTSALSPRTQTAQAGLSLLAASASYARDAVSLTPEMAFSAPATNTQNITESQETVALGSTSPFLTARGENATLMSQPHNSLAHNLSPRLVDRGGMALGTAQAYANQRHQQQRMVNGGGFVSPQGVMFVGAAPNGMATLTAAGRLTRNRTLLRQSSGLTSASFHNDLVPQATESFFAPLDEVCSDNGGGGGSSTDQQSFVSQGAAIGARQAPASSAGMLGTTTAPPPPPPMGTQFSPAMPMTNGVQAPQQAVWQNNVPAAYYSRPPGPQIGIRVSGVQVAGQQQQQQKQTSSAQSSAPDAIFSQMPSLRGALTQQQQSQLQATESGLASGLKRTRINQDGSFMQDDNESADYGSEDGIDEGGSSSGKRRRTRDPNSTPHKRDQERRFDCDVCNRSFARQYNLKTHRLTHFPDANESRPFNCPHCTKAFTRKHDLQRHASLHKRADKYSCALCNRGFQRKDALKRHTDSECTLC